MDMFVVMQGRKKARNMSDVSAMWLDDKSIVAEDLAGNLVMIATYETSKRAEEVFNDLLVAMGNVTVFYLPPE